MKNTRPLITESIRMANINELTQQIQPLSPRELVFHLEYTQTLNDLLEDPQNHLTRIANLLLNACLIKLLKSLTSDRAMARDERNLARRFKRHLCSLFMFEIDDRFSDKHQLNLLEQKNKISWLKEAIDHSSKLYLTFSSTTLPEHWLRKLFFSNKSPLINKIQQQLLCEESVTELEMKVRPTSS